MSTRTVTRPVTGPASGSTGVASARPPPPPSTSPPPASAGAASSSLPVMDPSSQPVAPASINTTSARRTGTAYRRLLVHVDRDVDLEGLGATADEDGAGGGRGVDVVAADRDADVVGLGEAAVGRVEALPAGLRQVDLRPGVGRLAHRGVGVAGAGVEVAADVARRDAKQAREADEEVGEVLADAEPVGVDVE